MDTVPATQPSWPTFPGLAETLGNLYDLWVFIDGQLVKGADARISIWDHGLLYGDGIYEGIRAYNGRIFMLDEHLARLYDSAQALQLAVPLAPAEFRAAILETVRANKLREAHIRPVVTRGVGKPGLDPRRAVHPSVIILASSAPPMLGDKPVRLMTTAIRRKAPLSVDARIKSLNYLDNILAKLQANAFGADDAILLDPSGYVAEATAQNIFLVKRGRAATPLLTASLPGITRQVVLERAPQLGLPVEERWLTPGDLYTADEVFLTGTASEIVPVAEIDGRLIGSGQTGEFTQRLLEDYQALVNQTGVNIYEE
jgi:branched-chain amino acid aminotransferase